MSNKTNNNENLPINSEQPHVENEAPERETVTDPTTSEKESKGNLGVYVHKFKKPHKFENTTYETLNFYFENLRGVDMIKIENEMQANDEFAIDPLLSKSFQSKIAARAANVGYDVIEFLPIHDFNRITNATRNFLINSGS